MGAQLLFDGAAPWSTYGAAAFVNQLVAYVIAVSLIVGLWTPFAAIALTLLEIGALVSGAGFTEGHVTRAVVGMSLAMLGPGAWSIDARLFGRRRIDVADVRGDGDA